MFFFNGPRNSYHVREKQVINGMPEKLSYTLVNQHFTPDFGSTDLKNL